MEAMGCGMVPVTSDCGDMADIVGERGAGHLLSLAAGVDDYANRVIELLDGQDVWSEQSRRAQEIIATEHGFFSAEQAWREVLSTLERAAP
jgi:glycosyltransferase involved in cell wall biosynthesis